MNEEPHTPGVFMKVGVIGVLLSRVILCLSALLSLLQSPDGASQNPADADGTTVSPLPSRLLQLSYPD
jgi:hypothetical protein